MHDTTVEDMQIVDELRKLKMSWKEIERHFSMKGYTFKADKYRIDYSHYKKWSIVYNKVYNKDECWLIMPDLHFPFEHKKALKFCVDVKNKYKPVRNIQMGDLLDNHRYSFHPDEPEAPSPIQERDMNKDKIKEWGKHFPELTIIRGNHDHMAERKVKASGMLPDMLYPLEIYYDMPTGWKYTEKVETDDVLIIHGINTKNPLKKALDIRKNVIVAHYHTLFQYREQTHKYDGKQYFGVNAGSLVDDNSIGMVYGKYFDASKLGAVLYYPNRTEGKIKLIPMTEEYFN